MKKRSLARFLHLNRPTARGGGFNRWKGSKRPGRTGVEEKMLTKMTYNERAMKAVRLGLIVTSWTFLVLGYVLTHNA